MSPYRPDGPILDGPILAATDFSPPGRHAGERAARLAQETGAALTLMHVLPGTALQALRQWLGSNAAIEQHLRDDAERQLRAAIAPLQADQRGAIQPLLVSGTPLDEIGREAEALNAGLLVLGARGAGYLRRLALGSTAERLLRRTTRPLLIVRQAPQGAYRCVLVALDFSSWSGQAVVLARQIAPHARLLLFHAYEVPFESKLRYAGVEGATIDHYRQQAHAEARQRVNDLAMANGLAPGEWEACIVEGEASQRIIECEQEKDCDLIVLGKHGQSVTEELLLGSVSRYVLAEAGCDVLVSTAHER